MLEAPAGGLTLMHSEKHGVELFFNLWSLLKNKTMFPLTIWSLPSLLQGFCLLAAVCCLWLQLCRAPVMNPRAFLFMLGPRFGLALRASFQKSKPFFFMKAACVPQPLLRRTLFSACQFLSWIKPLWFNGFVTCSVSNRLYQSCPLFHVKG